MLGVLEPAREEELPLSASSFAFKDELLNAGGMAAGTSTLMENGSGFGGEGGKSMFAKRGACEASSTDLSGGGVCGGVLSPSAAASMPAKSFIKREAFASTSILFASAAAIIASKSGSSSSFRSNVQPDSATLMSM
jgi:hypothetical protein